MEVNGYPLYRRRDQGRFIMKNGFRLDNRHVVPYCKYLTLKYNAHINVEVCSSIKAIKYVFKYVFKGHDCANVLSTEVDPHSLNEVREYTKTRYVSAPESMWRLNKFDICENSRTVVRLDIHLEDQQNVNIPGHAAEADIERALESSYESKLTAWFKLNRTDVAARQYLYIEIPKHYTWNAGDPTNDPTVPRTKHWKKRVNNVGSSVISRMYSVYPRDRERFYLRLLLFHVRGATSFSEVRTYEGVLYGTYEETCRVRGLLIDDSEWERTLHEACVTANARQVRDLFVTILGHCSPNNPARLWTTFKEHMFEDFVRFHRLTPELAEQYALDEMRIALSSNYGLQLATILGVEIARDLPPLPTAANPADVIDVQAETDRFNTMYRQLNEGQRFIADTITHSMETYQERPSLDRPRVFFTDAPGGTGKTFVCNTLIAKALSLGLKVASCAWTGIAGNLLRFGSTCHKLFKFPVPIDDRSRCSVSPISPHAQFLNSLSLIFVDEASMMSYQAIRCLDLMLRDISPDPQGKHMPFGGKLILFCGDFRQTLPVITHAPPAAILEQCMNRSPLWHHFTQLTLTQNMRALAGEEEFCQWLLDLGDGRLRSDHPDTRDDQVDIPPQCHVTTNVVDSIYPDLNADISNCIVLAPKNVDTHFINSSTLAKFKPDEPCRTYYSTDKYLETGGTGHEGMPVEFLHSQTTSGMPLHELQLKVGCPIMLLRNLDVKNGLCNGTRLRVVNLGDRCIDAEITSGSAAQIGRRVFIPRLKLTPSDAALPFEYERIQFPVRLCYCITINKSQGQTFDKVGIYLPEPVFSHGQLYVACSRARSFDNLYFQIGDTVEQYSTEHMAITKNVVWDVHNDNRQIL